MDLIHVKDPSPGADAPPSPRRGEGKGGELSTYDIAKQALALAVTVDEAKAIHDDAERMAFYARQANDRELIADAMALVMQARRRLGELLIKAKEAGQLSRGGRPSKDPSPGASRHPLPDGARGETTTKSEGVSAGQLTRVTLKEAGIDWKLSSEAQKLAGYAEDDFEAVIEKGRQKIRAGGAVVINPVKDLNTREKQLHRDVREAVLAAKQKALPLKKFGVILADPEWRFEVRSAAGLDRAADNHYPTSSLETIAARPVKDIAAEDCVLFLWVPMAQLAAGNHVAVCEGWGFAPKAVIIWDKVVTGTGYWVRNRVEALIIATRGHALPPAPGTQWQDLVSAPKGVHSEKPDWAYELIEAYFPNLPKIELNARRRRDGWDAWGFEAPDEIRSDDPVDAAGGGTLIPPAGPVAADAEATVVGRGESVTALPAGPRLTREEAEPILRERYATTDVEELQRVLGGVPINTIRGWAFKLGLTNVARRTAQLVERNRARGGAGSPERLAGGQSVGQAKVEAGEHAHD